MEYLFFVAIVTSLFILSAFMMKRICQAKQIKDLLGYTSLLVGGLLLFLFLFGWIRVEGGEADEKEKMRAPLEGLAPIFAHMLEMMDHSRISLSTSAADPHYQHLLTSMEEWMRLYPTMKSIYTLRKLPNGENVFILDPEVDYDESGEIDLSIEKLTPIGEIYPERLSELEQAFEGKETFQEVPYTDEWGTWISSFAPIHDSSGQVDAVLGIDFDYGVWAERIADARLRRMNHLLVPLVILLASYWLAFFHRLKSVEIIESEARYRQLVELSPDAVAVHQEGRIVFINEKGRDLLGAGTIDQLIGLPIIDLVHPDSREMVVKRVRQMLEHNEKGFTIEEKFIRLDGKTIEVEVVASPIVHHGKKAILVIARDITERKIMEDALRESEKRNRDLIEQSPDAIAVHSHYKILYMNRKGLELCGVTALEELYGKTIFDILHPDQHEEVKEYIHYMYLKDKPVEFLQLKLVKPNGELLNIETTNLPILYNDEPAIQVMFRDITEKKRLEEALWRSHERFRHIFEKAGMGMGLRKKSGEIIEINPMLEKMTGYKKEELKHLPISAISQAVEPEEHLFEELLAGKRDAYQIEKLYFRPDGQVVCGNLTVSLLPSEDQPEEYYVLGMVQDVTERKRMEKALKESEERYRQLVEHSLDLILVHVHGKIVFINDVAVSMVKVKDKEEIVGESILKFIHPDDHAVTMERVKRMLETNQPGPLQDLRIVRTDGKILYVEISACPIVYYGERAIQVIARDVTFRKEMEEALKQSEQQYRFIAENSTDIIAHLTADGNYLYVTPVMEDMLGYAPDELIGFSPFELIHPDHRDELKQALQDATVNTEIKMLTFSYRMRKKDGEYIWMETTARDIRNEEGGLEGILTVTRDITNRKMIEEGLRETNEILQRLSSIDGLTGIANRRYFDEFLEQEWARGIRHGYSLSLIMFDIDYFKKYNDTYGHQKGDQCLQEVARTSANTFKRTTDLVARYGGEEFSVILPHTEWKEAFRLAEQLRKNIEGMKIPHQASEIAEYVTISVGVATILPNSISASAELIEKADQALYLAKRLGRNRVMGSKMEQAGKTSKAEP